MPCLPSLFPVWPTRLRYLCRDVRNASILLHRREGLALGRTFVTELMPGMCTNMIEGTEGSYHSRMKMGSALVEACTVGQ